VGVGVPPTGTVTFLFTDVERSTQQWDTHPEEMRAAMRRHDVLLREAIDAQLGYVFTTAGDSFAAAFWTPHDALASALAIQRALSHELWPSSIAIGVRMGIHTGTADERDGDYFGPTLNRAARLMSAGHSGQILLSEVTARLVNLPDVVDLGEQRLKDLAAPERVFQVGDGVFPPLRSSGTLTVRLPEWDTRFWGRVEELEWLTERVPQSRVVVVTGPGGLGKTRLAAQVAERLASAFPDGVGFVGLAGLSEGDTEYAIAEGVGVRKQPDRSAIESVIGWLGDRRLLLVLDNCEGVATAARDAVQQLVRGCPGLHVLVTSRVPLGVAGEMRWPLRPLDDESAIGLFVDRVRATDPTFDPRSDPESLRALCGRLDGVPLAVELAAARCRTMSPEQLLVRFKRRPEVLADRSGLFEERHRDLDQLIGWSWGGLSRLAQSVLARLTVIIGSFTLETAEALGTSDGVDEHDVDEALEEVEDAGLITRERIGREVRHHLLEPIRQHVAAKLDDEERAATAMRHARWFAALAREVHTGSMGPDFGRWADLVERDLANFREAHRLHIEAGDADGALAIVEGLNVVGFHRGLMELADWCDATLAMVRGGDPRLEVAASAAAAPFWLFQNRVQDLLDAASRAALLDGHARDHLAVEEFTARATLDPADWGPAIERLGPALARYDPHWETWPGVSAALFLVLLGVVPASDLAPVVERLGSPVFAAMLAFYRAVPFYLEGEDETAVSLAGEGVSLARSAGTPYQLATALMGYGGWLAPLPRASTDEVFAPLLDSLDLWERLRIPWGPVLIIEEIAQALAIRGHPEEAFVLWGAVDATGVQAQAPSKVGRERRTDAAVARVAMVDRQTLRAQGASLTLDQAMLYGRRAVLSMLSS
jgi:predicted ATPase/class 3 adenylate cyclase